MEEGEEGRGMGRGRGKEKGRGMKEEEMGKVKGEDKMRKAR